MSSRDPPTQSTELDEFVEWLIARHEVIARGDAEAKRKPPTSDNDATRQQVEQAERGLRALESLRRNRQEGRAAESEPASVPPILSERQLGRYRVEREIGHGGLGIVFKAFDPELKRHVALKVPRPEAVLSSHLRRRFQSEAEAVARLQHPHVCAVHEVAHAGPVSFLVMEYCPGPSLAEWLEKREEPISPRAAAKFFVQVAEAVQHAHSRGVLHRDLKPSNVLLHQRADREPPSDLADDPLPFVPKVADFGLAKLMEEVGDGTRTGAVLGTADYMAPEQAEGRTRDIGVATDVFALGVMLYEVLTGRRPFAGATTSVTIRNVLLAEPPRRFRPDTPRDLAAICLKCLEKDPQKRYRSAAALADDLERWLAGQPTDARPIGAFQRLVKWSLRRPAIAALLAALFVALTVILVGGTWQLKRLERELTTNKRLRTEAEARERRERRRRYVADIQLAAELWSHHKLAETRRVLARQMPGDEQDRDFVWNYLWRCCHDELTIYDGHTGIVSAVAFSPDGTRVATGGHDGTARLFDTETGEQLALFGDHVGEVNCVAFSRDGHEILTGDAGGFLRKWEVNSAEQLLRVAGHADDILCLAIAPDGQIVATGGLDSTIRLWNASDLTPLGELPGHTDWVRSVAFSPDGSMLVSGSNDHSARLWDVTSQQELSDLTGGERHVYSVFFHPDGKHFVRGEKLGWVILQSLEGDRDKVIWKSGDYDERTRQVAFSPNGKVLAVAGNGDAVALWHFDKMGDKPRLYMMAAHDGDTWALAFSPDGKTVVTTGADGLAKRWLVRDRDGDELWDIAGQCGNRIAMRGDLIAPQFVGSVRVFHRTQRTQTLHHDLPATDSGAIVSISADGEHVAFGQQELRIHAVSIDQPEQVRQIGAPAAHLFDLAHGEDPRSIFAVYSKPTVSALDTRSGAERIMRLSNNEDMQFCRVTVSRDGRWLAAADDTSLDVAVVYDLVKDKVQCTLDDCDRNIALSPQGRLVAMGAADRTIRIWNVQTGRVQKTLAGHDSKTEGLEFSPDARILVSLGQDGAIKLWSVEEGEELLRLSGAEGRVVAATFTPDGKTLVLAEQVDDRANIVFHATEKPAGGRTQFRHRIGE